MLKSKLSFQIFLIVTAIIGLATSQEAANVSKDFYIESKEKLNWFQAWNDCKQRHMTLVTLDSKEKTELLIRELRTVFGADPPNIWIGGNDNAETHHFIWAATNKPFSYTNWSRGQPDNKGGKEHCVLLWESHDYQWNDGDCLARMNYVCEKN